MGAFATGPGPRVATPDIEPNQASALCVEVSAWRGAHGSRKGGRKTLERADGVCVYICNPLPLPVREFVPGVGTLEQARAAAFKWADTLAEHLGCDVVAVLPRPAAPAAPEIDTETLCDMAMVLWEAVLDLRSESGGENTSPAAELIEHRFDSEGTMSVRESVVQWAAQAELAWRALSEDVRESMDYDWEFVPRWLRWKLESQLNASAQHGFEWEPSK